MNQPKDVEIVDYYLSAIEAVKSLTLSRTATTEMAIQRLLGVVQKNIPWNDRSAAIRALQAECAITDPAEKQDGLILPGQETLKALVDLGDIADKLLGNDDALGSRYMHRGSVDWIVFSREFSSRFHRHTVPHGLAELLGIHAGGEALAVLADDLEGDGHGAVLDEEHDLLEEIGEVDLVPGHGRGPGILEKIPDDPVQTLRLP